jgi:hypothetical protein
VLRLPLDDAHDGGERQKSGKIGRQTRRWRNRGEPEVGVNLTSGPELSVKERREGGKTGRRGESWAAGEASWAAGPLE